MKRGYRIAPLVLILAGVLLLLQKWVPGAFTKYWPLLLVLIGLLKIVDAVVA